VDTAASILVIRLRELGDTLLTTPVLRQLRRLHPAARIDVLCQAGSRRVLEHNRRVDGTVVLPPRASPAEFVSLATQLRRRRYDLVVDVQSLPKTALFARLVGGRERIGYRKPGWRNRLCYTRPHRQQHGEYAARQHLRLLQDDRVDYDDVDLEFEVGPQSLAAADEFVRRHLRPPFAAIFGICRFGTRAWPAEKTAAVADRLAALGIQPLLVYGPGQEESAAGIAARMRHRAVHGYPMPDFPTLRAILGRAEVFFGNDGGPKHAAVAAGIPTVTVCDAMHATGWAPPNDPRHRVVATRVYPGAAPLAGTFTESGTLADIPVAAAWHEVAAALREAARAVPARATTRAA
jgi:ADP-heptose:LPS heptosyltransferase